MVKLVLLKSSLLSLLMDWNKIYVCWEKNGTLGRVSGGHDTLAALQRIGRLFQGRPGKGTPRIGVGVTPSVQKRKAVLILPIIKLERRNRLTCFLIMYYFCPFTMEAQTAVFMLGGYHIMDSLKMTAGMCQDGRCTQS